MQQNAEKDQLKQLRLRASWQSSYVSSAPPPAPLYSQPSWKQQPHTVLARNREILDNANQNQFAVLLEEHKSEHRKLTSQHVGTGAQSEGEESTNNNNNVDSRRLLDEINSNIIGSGDLLEGPYGKNPLTYLDWVASGRALRQVESYIADNILPMYANTHTTASNTGLYTGVERENARDAILKHVHGDPEKDFVIFVGAGVTGCTNKLVNSLQIPRYPNDAVVFVGPYEHNSNLLPWRESGALVVMVPDSPSGNGLDLEYLQDALQRFHKKKLKIGSFSAVSNVTGVCENVDEVAKILHSHDAFAFFDYASGAPYLEMNMNPSTDSLAYKDAIFISPHKFVGGPGSSGVMICKQHLFSLQVPPETPGGGTVAFVTQESHIYTAHHSEREEAGTPNILGCIRAGLAIKIKESIGYAIIAKREGELVDAVLKRLVAVQPNFELLGPPLDKVKRIPTFSFLVKASQGKCARYLHPNFVAALLNDLYGIQVRSGCFCASIYLYPIEGLSKEAILADEAELFGGKNKELLRFGATRFALPYFVSEEEVAYVIDAIAQVCEHGWKLLPFYTPSYSHATWVHQAKALSINLNGVGQSSLLFYKGKRAQEKQEKNVPSYASILERNLQVYQQVDGLIQAMGDYPAKSADEVTIEKHPLRYFLTCFEAFIRIKSKDFSFVSLTSAEESDSNMKPIIQVDRFLNAPNECWKSKTELQKVRFAGERQVGLFKMCL